MALAETARLIASLELQDKFSKSADAAIRKSKQVESSFNRIGKAGTTGLGTAAKTLTGVLAGVGIVAGLKTSITAASDLNETVSKVGVVFDQQAARVIAFGDTAAAALGLSNEAALAGAATFGNLFKAMDISDKKSADMSLALVGLASDLASFNNIDPTEALDKLRAGLTGESEPLKSLGVNINETLIKAKAFELGLVDATASSAELKLKTIALSAAQKTYNDTVKKYGKESIQATKAAVAYEKASDDLEKTTNKIPATLTAAQKAQASYALIFEQTTAAQGDFSRTSEGLANQQRILRANLTNTAATIGTALLPKVTELAQRINKLVVDNQPKIAELAAQLPAIFDKAVELGQKIPWEQVGKGLETAAKFSGDLINAFANMPPEAQATLIALAGLNKLSGGAVGGIITELGKGLIKGVLGMTAGVVNINAATVNGGGIPGAAGAAAAGAAGGGIAAGIKALIPVVGLVAIAAQVAGELDKQRIGNLGLVGRTEEQLRFAKENRFPDADIEKLAKRLAALQSGRFDSFIAEQQATGASTDEVNRTLDTRLAIDAALQRDANRILGAALTRPMPAPIVTNTVRIDVNISGQDVTSITLRDRLASQGITYSPGGMVGF